MQENAFSSLFKFARVRAAHQPHVCHDHSIMWKSRTKDRGLVCLAQNERKMVYLTHSLHKFDNFRAMQKFLLILCGQFW